MSLKPNLNKAERKVLKRIKDKDEDNNLPGHDILFISQSRKIVILRKCVEKDDQSIKN